jgi:L-ribulose-5-phosphate 4-epimerase
VLDQLRERVLAANLALVEHRLVKLTWGNVSGVDRTEGVMAIKASGVDYARMTAADIVLVDVAGGELIEGGLRPSTDTPTHLALYRSLPEIGGVVHTHSTWATAWAQAEREIPVLGTTHADLCSEPIPVTRALTPEEVREDYEGATGMALLDAIAGREHELSCALVRGHAPFCWGRDPATAVEVAVTLEEVAKLALLTVALAADAGPLDEFVRAKHFERKHGPRAYYGQR